MNYVIEDELMRFRIYFYDITSLRLHNNNNIRVYMYQLLFCGSPVSPRSLPEGGEI